MSVKTTRRSLRASAPRFVQPLEVRDENQLRVLECRVDGYPKPDVRWEKSYKPVGKSRRVHMIRTGDRCLLQIKMPQNEDGGLYSCTATNIVGIATTQLKVPGTCTTAEKMNGNSSQSLNSKVNGIRSRMVAKSTESVSETKHLRNVFRIRSQSGTRKPREDSGTLGSSKTKLATFTSHILGKSDVLDDPPTPCALQSEEAPMSLRKKQLSKSVEDCRKNKRGFLNRVKIPDIFSAQRVATESQVEKDKTIKNGEFHTNGEIKTGEKTFVKPSTNTLKINKELSKDAVDAKTTTGEVEIPPQLSTRERIAAYLKRFENSSVSIKAKGLQPEPIKSVKRTTGNEKKIDSNTSDRAAEDSTFFSFGKFRRRKSSDNCKNSVQKTENLLVKANVDDVSKCEKGSETNSSGDILNIRIQREITVDTTLDENCVPKAEHVPKTEGDVSLGNELTNGFSKVEKPSDSSPYDIDLGTYQHIDINLLDSFKDLKQSPEMFSAESKQKADTVPQMVEKDSKCDALQTNGETDFVPETISTQDTFSKDENSTTSEALFIDTFHKDTEDNSEEFKENQVPIIHIELSPEEGDIQSDDTSNEIIIPYEVPEERWDKEPTDIFKKAYRGKIKYSSPLIEEECEDLLGEDSAHNASTLEPHLQRVSSPEESPARIVKGPQSVTVLRGESVTLAISFSGYPTPNVIWMKGGRVLSSVGRLSVLEGREMSVVTVNDVTADDSGKYVVSVENEGGGDSCFASVAVVGFPEPPGGEPTANEVTDHSLVLSWYGSMYDGGSVVTGYQVEMCTLTDKKTAQQQRWYKVASSVNTSCTVLGLSKGQRYMFRVRAENRYGTSHPSKESKVIKLDDFLKDESSADEEAGEELAPPVEVETGTNFTERFDLKEEVGKGRFGTVYRCVEKSCGRPRAAKVIRCLKVKDKEKVRQEIEIMSRLHHPKLMQVLAAFESGRNMIMVMEFISGGELFERVIADDFVLTEQDCILFMRQICDGVAYMHKNDILHLDLKPENILCKTRSSHKIKIIDFGLARVYKADESLRVLFGTPEFVAPEVINYEPVCPSSDMWSLGVICYVLLSGLSPFMGDSDTETFANITRGDMDFDDEAFDEISQDAKDFISKLLIKNVRNRLSAEECLKHPWLATAGLVQKRPLSTEKLKRYFIRRKWQKSGTAIRALGRMVSMSRSSLGSSCESYSPLGSPTSSRSRSSLLSRSETTESGESDVFQDLVR